MMVSVIIPVYNVKAFLHQCIDSVLAQTYQDFELLLINDGSTDSSGAICDAYVEKDARVRVFHQQNGGVSSARNLGIENAKGEWITFVDSDDYISTDYFEPLKKEQNVDWILFGIDKVVDGKISKLVTFNNRVYNITDFVKYHNIPSHFFGPTAKFYKTAIIKLNNLLFDHKLKYGEDTIFNVQYLKCCKNVLTMTFPIYYYCENSGSLSKINFDLNKDEYFFQKLENELLSHPLLSLVVQSNLRYILFRYFMSIIGSSEITGKDKYIKLQILKKKYKNLLVEELENERIFKMKYSFVLKYNLLFIPAYLLKIKNK